MKVNWTEINDFIKGLGSMLLVFILWIVIILLLDKYDIDNIFFIISLCGIVAYGIYIVLFKLITNTFFDKWLTLLMFIAISIMIIYSEITNDVQSNNKIEIIKKSIFKSEDQKYKYSYGTIEEKITILKSLGLSKQQVYNKLKNNTDFRSLVKNNDKQFNLLYDKALKTKE